MKKKTIKISENKLESFANFLTDDQILILSYNEWETIVIFWSVELLECRTEA